MFKQSLYHIGHAQLPQECAPPLHVADHRAECARADAHNGAAETPDEHTASLRVAVSEVGFLLTQASVDLAPEGIVERVQIGERFGISRMFTPRAFLTSSAKS